MRLLVAHFFTIERKNLEQLTVTINQRKDKHITVYSYIIIPFSNEKGWYRFIHVGMATLPKKLWRINRLQRYKRILFI